jgi:signal transduction histidine kinase
MSWQRWQTGKTNMTVWLALAPFRSVLIVMLIAAPIASAPSPDPRSALAMSAAPDGRFEQFLYAGPDLGRAAQGTWVSALRDADRVREIIESNRRYLLAGVALALVQLLLTAGLLSQRAGRQRAEELIRAREATLRRSYERIRRMAGRLIDTEEVTRANIARDLHEGVCQDLACISVEIGNLKRSSGRIQDPRVQEGLSALQRSVRNAVGSVRQLSHELHPATLRLVGLKAALKTHCAEVQTRSQLQVTFTADGDFQHLPPELALSLFRIAQEALRNAIVHGHSSHLTVNLSASGNQIDLAVTDDGRGFDPESVHRSSAGLGLISIEERAHLAGGNVAIISRPGHGACIRVRVPGAKAASAKPKDASLTVVAPVAASFTTPRERVWQSQGS